MVSWKTPKTLEKKLSTSSWVTWSGWNGGWRLNPFSSPVFHFPLLEYPVEGVPAPVAQGLLLHLGEGVVRGLPAVGIGVLENEIHNLGILWILYYKEKGMRTHGRSRGSRAWGHYWPRLLPYPGGISSGRRHSRRRDRSRRMSPTWGSCSPFYRSFSG